MTYRGAIFDIDGVLEYQGRALPGAVDTLNALRARGIVLRFLTNSTLKSRASAAARLRARGISADESEVVTASSATALYLRRRGVRSAYVMLDREGLDEFRDIPQDLNDPEVVVVGDNRSCFDFDHLNHALRLLKRGAGLVGMMDELIDSSMGELELNVGSWVGMLERASGVPAVYIGKPSPFVFQLTLHTMGLPQEQVLMIGDRVKSDIAGAAASGLPSALLRTGEFDPRDLDAGPRPTYIFDSIDHILPLFGDPPL